MKVLSIDPGREKCGVAVVEDTPRVLWQAIIPRAEFERDIGTILLEWQPDAVLLGHATTSQALHKVLLAHTTIPIHIVEETGSTLEARELFWQANPPCGWRRWVPLSLQEPPVPLDDFAAIVLARRFFQT
jgi:RNase H-fold protein (predicted Holliday junction resolvase)